MNVVVVESPAKADTIEKYLGPDYKVLATYGHVRDLREKPDSVVTDDGFRMIWEVDSESKKRIKPIEDSLKNSDRLILATDPDREGEAISWHLVETLRERKSLKDQVDVQRVSFNSVTKQAVTEAFQHPREIDRGLVDAYIARRALDYLVGFKLSILLLRKLPGARSAGRVQSVALRLVVDRETEIEAFQPQEHWSVIAYLRTADGAVFPARLSQLHGDKIEKFTLADEAAATAAKAVLEQADAFVVSNIESKPVSRSPAPPFITSTLQQEASNKLGSSAKRTMATAQRLYEAGLITYMRTDGIDMAPEAVNAVRQQITAQFGQPYTPEQPRMYKSKAKNAQEAHECIRPTDISRTPEQIGRLPDEQRALYELIWKRTMASQMANAQLERTTATIDTADDGPAAQLRATGQVVKFDGFQVLYPDPRVDRKRQSDAPEDADDAADDNTKLPPLRQGDQPDRDRVEANQHFTKPPARYSEASLVRELESRGIGRPSTYATILSVIVDRGYVENEQRRLKPTFLGRLATAFLESRFERYVAYDFTADLEEKLDDITNGHNSYTDVLQEFWNDFEPALDEAEKLRVREAINDVEQRLEEVLFPPRQDGKDPRLCPRCNEGRLNLRLSRRTGVFLGCERYPECDYTSPIGGKDEAEWAGDRELGVDPDGKRVLVRKGPFGFYFQLGQPEGDRKPKRVSLPDGIDPSAATFDEAMQYLALPRAIGTHPESGEPVQAGIGRYGPYVLHQKVYASIPKGESVLEVGLNRAVDLLATKLSRRGGGRASARTPLKELGEHPDGGVIQVLDGRYGPYVKWNGLNATLPDGMAPEAVTREEAVELLAIRASRKRTRGATKSRAGGAKRSPTGRKPTKRTSGKADKSSADA